MYNLRYHVASLVAVFLALTVGLLLGTVVAERGTLDEGSRAMVEDLQRQFKALQTENTQLSTDLDRAAGFSSDVAPALVAGRLQDMTVAVVVNAGRGNGLSALVDVLEQSGATPVVYTFETPGLGLNEALPNGLPALIGGEFATEGSGPASQAFIDAVAMRLAEEWSSAGSRPVTELLVSQGVLSVRGDAAATAADACVSMSAFDGEPDAFARAVIAAFDDAGLLAAAAEASTQETGVAADAADAGLSAVDHVETPQGAVSLVWLLSGEAEGYFGFGQGAKAPYPDVVTAARE
jgi:hypothetical protein